MDKALFLTFILMLHLMTVHGQDFDCPYRECSCYMTRIMCDDHELEELPALTTTKATVNTYLSADNNLITTIPAGSLPTGLMQISMMNNPLTTIEDKAFDQSSSTLLQLSFSNVRFSRIPDAFLHLNTLQNLNIYETNITDWNVEAMKHIGPNLQTLYLENVGLDSWPNWLQYFPRISELSIFGSAISSIPDDAFDNMTGSLMTLSLTSNNLVLVPKAISKLTALQQLTFDNSKISDLTWLPSAGILSTLAIENANISDADHVSSSLLPVANTLMTLRLPGNKLTKIPDLSFMGRLTTIDLTHNRLIDAVSGSLPVGLSEIDLTNNQLPAMPHFFSSLKTLSIISLSGNTLRVLIGSDFPPAATEADFGFNLITELTDTSFPENSTLQTLILSDNPLSKISDDAFKNLPALQMLEMQNTNLGRLPLGLSFLKHLNNLDLTGVPKLVCTCAEAGLRTVLLKQEELKGDCGHTSIAYFFSYLAVSCPKLH